MSTSAWFGTRHETELEPFRVPEELEIRMGDNNLDHFLELLLAPTCLERLEKSGQIRKTGAFSRTASGVEIPFYEAVQTPEEAARSWQ
jgi:hypothetical protein